MLARHMGGRMAGGVQQGQLHLNGAVGQQPGQLGLGGNFGGHQVQRQNPQRADLLAFGPLAVHYKYVFLPQRRIGGQVLRDDQRHGSLTPLV